MRTYSKVFLAAVAATLALTACTSGETDETTDVSEATGEEVSTEEGTAASTSEGQATDDDPDGLTTDPDETPEPEGSGNPSVEPVGSFMLDPGTFGVYFVSPGITVLDGDLSASHDDALVSVTLSGAVTGQAGVYGPLAEMEFSDDGAFAAGLDLEPFLFGDLQLPADEFTPMFAENYQVLMYDLEGPTDLDDTFEVTFEFERAEPLTAQVIVLQNADGELADALDIDMDEMREDTIDALRDEGFDEDEIEEILEELGY